MLGEIPGLGQIVSSDGIDERLADQWDPPTLDRTTPAFLQYTSGSTGTPKGVLVRHGNILANLAQMEQLLDVDNAIACTWLPPYHDMGLVGAILQCWYSGRRNVFLSPLSFFQQPLRWLCASPPIAPRPSRRPISPTIYASARSSRQSGVAWIFRVCDSRFQGRSRSARQPFRASSRPSPNAECAMTSFALATAWPRRLC